MFFIAERMPLPSVPHSAEAGCSVSGVAWSLIADPDRSACRQALLSIVLIVAVAAPSCVAAADGPRRTLLQVVIPTRLTAGPNPRLRVGTAQRLLLWHAPSQRR